MRLVTLNMRDYRGSAPYSPAELAALGSADPRLQRSMIQARGLEIAAFLLRFIQEEDIPPPSHAADYSSARGGGPPLEVRERITDLGDVTSAWLKSVDISAWLPAEGMSPGGERRGSEFTSPVYPDGVRPIRFEGEGVEALVLDQTLS